MNKKFKLIYPEQGEVETKKEEIFSKTRAVLKNRVNGILAKVLLFIYDQEPCSNSEISSFLTQFYKYPYDKANLRRYLHELINLGLIFSVPCSVAYKPKLNEQSKIIKEKHQIFLNNIPKQFRSQFVETINYYSTTPLAEEFIPWCSEVVGFKVEEDKKLKGGKDGDI